MNPIEIVLGDRALRRWLASTFSQSPYAALQQARTSSSFKSEASSSRLTGIANALPSDQCQVHVETNPWCLFVGCFADLSITPVMKAVIELGYLDIKPSIVRIKNCIITTESGPLFGFDIDNEFISGFDKGARGTLLGASHG
ncbi:hypothetical protein AB6848_16130 [Serratia proteamaculans]|nr:MULTISPECIES: hypothetical protein [Serratia]MDW5512446.1 hypothetical protein [Serratia proteamaculans]